MSRQQHVEVELPAELAGLILACGGEQRPRLQVAFKTAVVDEHFNIHGGQSFQGAANGGNRLVDLELRHRFRLLPAADKGRTGSDEPHAQAVLKHMHGPWANGQLSRAIADIATQADRVEILQIRAQRLKPHVEIVIAEGDVLITAEIHRLRAGMRARLFPRDVSREGRAL